MAKEAFFTFAKLGLQLKEEFGIEDVYENDEELRLQLISVKGLKKSAELIKSRFTRYANASAAVVLAGRTATSALADISRLARPRHQGLFATTGSHGEQSTDTSLVAVTNSTNEGGLCSKELRQLLFAVSRAERDVHEALSAFTRAIDVTMVKPRKDFLEIYVTEFRARKNSFKEAKRNYKAHARAQQRGQDSDFSGVNGIERFELAEARSAYENAEVELARYASKLEEENDRNFMHCVAKFAIQHHATFLRCLAALEKVLPLCNEYVSDSYQHMNRRTSQGSSFDSYFVSEGLRSPHTEALSSIPNSGALTFIRNSGGFVRQSSSQLTRRFGTSSGNPSSYDFEPQYESLRSLICRLVILVWRLAAKLSQKNLVAQYSYANSLPEKNMEKSSISSSDTKLSVEDFRRALIAQRSIIHRLIASRWLTAARFSQTQRAVVSFTSLPWRKRTFRLAVRLVLALKRLQKEAERLELEEKTELCTDDEVKDGQNEILLQEQERRLAAEREVRRLKCGVVTAIRQFPCYDSEISVKSDNLSSRWLGGWDSPEIVFVPHLRKVFLHQQPLQGGKGTHHSTNYIQVENDDYYSYEYDAVYDTESSQEQILESVADLLVAALEKKSGTLLIFGSSAEAEMHTAIGLRDDPGVFLLAVIKLLRVLTSDESLYVSFEAFDSEGNSKINLLSNYKCSQYTVYKESSKMFSDSSQVQFPDSETKKMGKEIQDEGEYYVDFGQYWKSSSCQQNAGFVQVRNRRECERILSHSMREYSFISREKEDASNLLISLKLMTKDRLSSGKKTEGYFNIAILFCGNNSLDENYRTLHEQSKMSLCDSFLHIRQLLLHQEDIRITYSHHYPQIIKSLIERGAFARNGSSQLAIVSCVDPRTEIEVNADLLEFISHWRPIFLSGNDNSNYLRTLLFDSHEEDSGNRNSDRDHGARRIRKPLRSSANEVSRTSEPFLSQIQGRYELHPQGSTSASFLEKGTYSNGPQGSDSSPYGSKEVRIPLKSRRPFRVVAEPSDLYDNSDSEKKDDLYKSTTFQYVL
eukprot:jgi/Galph1/443/GphlegSOOS_G5282.1